MRLFQNTVNVLKKIILLFTIMFNYVYRSYVQRFPIFQARVPPYKQQ